MYQCDDGLTKYGLGYVLVAATELPTNVKQLIELKRSTSSLTEDLTLTSK